MGLSGNLTRASSQSKTNTFLATAGVSYSELLLVPCCQKQHSIRMSTRHRRLNVIYISMAN